jgi:dipeptide/tripeptide permease
MGVWFLSISVGDVVGGWASGFYDSVSLEMYFGVSGLLAIGAGLLVVMARKRILRLMSGIR